MVINPYSTCKNCGERLEGDGFSNPMRCPDAAEDDWCFSAPDEGPFYCEPPSRLPKVASQVREAAQTNRIEFLQEVSCE